MSHPEGEVLDRRALHSRRTVCVRAAQGFMPSRAMRSTIFRADLGWCAPDEGLIVCGA
jgi:hypothetical protein